MSIFNKYFIRRCTRTAYVLFFLVGCALLTTCRKNEFTKPDPIYTPVSNHEEISFFTSTRISANVFLADILNSGADSSTPPIRSVAACFSNSLITAFDPSLGATIDSVKFNGAHLKFNRYYYSMDSLDPTAATIWQAYFNSFGSLTYNYPQAFAYCPEFYTMPDTFYQKTAYLKFLTTSTNLDSGAVVLTDGLRFYSCPFDKVNKRILVSIPMMQHFPINKPLELLLICTNNFPTMHGSMRVCISANHIYRKKVFLLP